MAQPTELYARLMEDARNYDPAAHHRGLLAPYREVLLLWRAKFMSYEQIAATLSSHGIKVSSAGVGVYCRGHFTKSEIERVRRDVLDSNRSPGPGRGAAGSAAAAGLRPAESTPNRRGPKIAPDNYGTRPIHAPQT
ncbi:MAG: hypothetical protein WD941_08710, partial [Opitutus sp.]